MTAITAFVIWISGLTHRQLDLRVTVPEETQAIRVQVACEHSERISYRLLDPPVHTQVFLFRDLHPDLYVVISHIWLPQGKEAERRREVFVVP